MVNLNNEIEKLKKYLRVSDLRPNTQRKYVTCAKVFLTYLNKPSNEATLDDVIDFLTHLKNQTNLNIGTINHYRSCIKYLFEVVLDIPWNDNKIRFLRGYRSEPKIFSKEEIQKILNCTSSILFKTIFALIYSSGLRNSEAINLRFSDIDSKKMQIFVREGKGGCSRYAVLSHKCLEMLQEYYDKYWKIRYGKWSKDDFIFSVMPTNSQMSQHTLRVYLKEAADKAGITKKYSIHTFRHSFAVHLIENGVDLLTVKNLLGHRHISSTICYLHLANTSKFNTPSPFDV